MRRPLLLAILLAASLAMPAALGAQSLDESIQAGIQAQLARLPQDALSHFEAALSIDPRSYEANWRAAEILMDLGKQTPDSVKSAARDSLYARAETLARVAVEVDSTGADGWYALAAAIGRASLTKSKKERVRRAGEVREAALRALAIEPDHHKALHVLGRWNAEIMRLSGLQRFFAKNFLGGGIFNAASWDSAVVYMERAVAASPENVYHHLDLGEILIDRKRYSEAREHLERAQSLPIFDVSDPEYQERARALLRRIEGKRDEH
jgi:tetratricopeptide (TPR) repeat protein